MAFSTTTGALQHLDALSASVLTLIEDSPATVAAVAQRISAETELVLSGDMVSGIASILDGLHRNGFLECLDR